jgi:hypothetical protein
MQPPEQEREQRAVQSVEGLSPRKTAEEESRTTEEVWSRRERKRKTTLRRRSAELPDH